MVDNVNNKENDIRPVLIIYPTLFSLLILNYLVYQKKVKFAGVILSVAHIKTKGVSFSFPESSYILLRRTGVWYATYLLFMIKGAYLFLLFWRISGFFTGKKVELRTFSKIFKEYGIPVFKSEDINNEAAVNFMRDINANFIVSIYNNQILRYQTCKKFTYGAIGIHNSYLPDFGGLDAAFEGLFHFVKETGTTAHYVDTGIDTGDVICQEKISIDPMDTVFSLNIRQWIKGAQMIPLVLDQIEKGNVKVKKQDFSKVQYPYQSFPSKERVKEFHRKQKNCIRLREVFILNEFLCNVFGVR